MLEICKVPSPSVAPSAIAKLPTLKMIEAPVPNVNGVEEVSMIKKWARQICTELGSDNVPGERCAIFLD